MIGQPSDAPEGCTTTAVLVVDVQRDFCQGGALAVPDGDRVVSVLNQVVQAAHARRLTVYATRDWHPPTPHTSSRVGAPGPSTVSPAPRVPGFTPTCVYRTAP